MLTNKAAVRRNGILSCSFACLVLCGCGTHGSSQVCVAQATAPLFGGNEDAGSWLGPKTEDFESSIGRVSIEGNAEDGSRSTGTCTATRISATWVLTAGHCLLGLTEPRILLDFARDQRDASPECDPTTRDENRVVRWLPHPETDLLLLEVAAPARFPIPISTETIALDAIVYMAGYGLREDHSQGVREFLPARVTSIDDDHLRASAGDDRGACIGDSGGPLLDIDAEGAPQLVGVLSKGSPTCVGFDDFVRIDRAFTWVSANIGEPGH
jgi:hypothetical protein